MEGWGSRLSGIAILLLERQNEIVYYCSVRIFDFDTVVIFVQIFNYEIIITTKCPFKRL